MEKKLLNKMKDLVKEGRAFWGKVGDKHGWSMEGRGVTIWVDDDFEFVDSLYNPTNSDTSYIVNRDTEELIKEIKH
tara:strand:+ start:96 stop:323 length:228 start_codon:yes stop_codon:yes gene_type:complete